LKLNREVVSTRARVNPLEKRNISWDSTELEVDWPIAQSVACSVYGLGNCSCNETYGQTKINHVVLNLICVWPCIIIVGKVIWNTN
jgi:hypothetical protein